MFACPREPVSFSGTTSHACDFAAVCQTAAYLPLDLLFSLFELRAVSKVVLGQQGLDVLNGVPGSPDAADLIPCAVGAAGITNTVPMVSVCVL